MSNRDLDLNNKKELVKKDGTREIKTFLISIIIAVISVTATYIFVRTKYDTNISRGSKIMQGELPEAATADEGYDNLLMNLKQIRQKIDEEFVGETNEQELVQQAIKGYVKGLNDDYTEYYTPEEWTEYKESLDGEFFGIGIYMSQDADKNTVVVAAMKDTPAEKAGLKAGDIIYKVNDEEVLGVDSNLISRKIKGPAGTTVKLTLVRAGKELEKEITRKKITVVNVSSRMIDKTIGYIKVDSFDSHVSDDFTKQYQDLTKKGMKKLILDLRNNAGGDVKETNKMLDVFLPKNTTMYYTKDSKDREIEEVAQDDHKIDIPIVILANKYSASASEIVIAALLDNNKAKLIGEKTYGKGVIQTVFETSTGSALKITTMEYFRPNNERIHKVGIEPTIKVKIDETKKDSKGEVIDSQLNRAIKELKK